MTITKVIWTGRNIEPLLVWIQFSSGGEYIGNLWTDASGKVWFAW